MANTDVPREAASPLLLSLAQAAKIINVCERTVWTLVHSGDLPHIRIGRRVLISRAAIENWITAKENNHPAE